MTFTVLAVLAWVEQRWWLVVVTLALAMWTKQTGTVTVAGLAGARLLLRASWHDRFRDALRCLVPFVVVFGLELALESGLRSPPEAPDRLLVVAKRLSGLLQGFTSSISLRCSRWAAWRPRR